MGEVAEVLRATLERLGPNGENWASDGPGRGETACVLLTLTGCAIRRHATYASAYYLVAGEIGTDDIPGWNDNPNTTWEDVALVLKRALARAEDEGL